MCLAITPGKVENNSLLTRLWQPVARTPVRLLGFAAGFHAITLLAILRFLPANDIAFSLTGFIGLYGIVTLAIFGYLLQQFPAWAERSPVHYMRYNSIYLMGQSALILLEISIYSGTNWLLAGGVLLIATWLFCIHSLKQIAFWANSRQACLHRIIIMLYSGALFSLVTLAGLYLHHSTLIQLGLLLPVSITLPAILYCLFRLETTRVRQHSLP